MDGTLSVREQGKRNVEFESAFPLIGVESKQQGSFLIVLTCSAGLGELKGRMILSGFYDPTLDDEAMVSRVGEARSYLFALKDWIVNKGGPVPKNPWRIE